MKLFKTITQSLLCAIIATGAAGLLACGYLQMFAMYGKAISIAATATTAALVLAYNLRCKADPSEPKTINVETVTIQVAPDAKIKVREGIANEADTCQTKDSGGWAEHHRTSESLPNAGAGH